MWTFIKELVIAPFAAWRNAELVAKVAELEKKCAVAQAKIIEMQQQLDRSNRSDRANRPKFAEADDNPLG